MEIFPVFCGRNLFISQAAYSLIENSQNGIVAEHTIKLSNLCGVTTDYLLKGGKMLVRMNPCNGFVPLIKKNAHAGFVENMDKELYLQNSEWYRIPGFNPAEEQLLFEVEGEYDSDSFAGRCGILSETKKKIIFWTVQSSCWSLLKSFW